MEQIVRIVVLNDGETFTDIGGCSIIECSRDRLEDVAEMLEHDHISGPVPKKDWGGEGWWNIAELLKKDDWVNPEYHEEEINKLKVEKEELTKEIEELREIDHQEYSVRRDEDIKDLCGIDDFPDLEDFVFEHQGLKEQNEKLQAENHELKKKDKLASGLIKRLNEREKELKDQIKKLRKWEDYPNVDLIHPRAIAIASGEDPDQYMRECSAESLGKMIKEHRELKEELEDAQEKLAEVECGAGYDDIWEKGWETGKSDCHGEIDQATKEFKNEIAQLHDNITRCKNWSSFHDNLKMELELYLKLGDLPEKESDRYEPTAKEAVELALMTAGGWETYGNEDEDADFNLSDYTGIRY